MKFAFFTAEKVAFPSQLCGAFWHFRRAATTARRAGRGRCIARRDKRLTEQITEVNLTSKRRYGNPRVHAEIKAAGTRVGRRRAASLMRFFRLRYGACCFATATAWNLPTGWRWTSGW